MPTTICSLIVLRSSCLWPIRPSWQLSSPPLCTASSSLRGTTTTGRWSTSWWLQPCGLESSGTWRSSLWLFIDSWLVRYLLKCCATSIRCWRMRYQCTFCCCWTPFWLSNTFSHSTWKIQLRCKTISGKISSTSGWWSAPPSRKSSMSWLQVKIFFRFSFNLLSGWL